MANLLDQMLYGLSQATRVGWYAGQYALARRLSVAQTGPRRRNPKVQAAMREAMLRLYRDDWRNVRQGCYLPPEDAINPWAEIGRSLAFFSDLPEVAERRREGRSQDLATTSNGGALPRYYLQNFHYQTDGYLSERSARIYDTQVEILFSGTAEAMRRQALRPLQAHLAGRRQQDLLLLDLGCGTGRFLRMVKQNWPRLGVMGVDLSPHYLAKARRALRRWSRVSLLQMPAERLALPDRSVDVVSAVYLFHELPAKVREQVIAEARRVLRPGGLFLLVDSLQTGDMPELDPLLAAFPAMFHEPYYADYIGQDIGALFARHGLALAETRLAFLSKVFAFVMPA